MGVYTALLIGGQLALSFVSGVEIVTLLLLGFAYKFGIRRGVIVATAFSLLRCLLFGFFPNIIILYLVYYNLFVIVIGGVGNLFHREIAPLKHVIIIILALMLTLIFFLLDNVITPLYYGFDKESAMGYAMTSLYALVPQLICVLVTISLLLRPLVKVLGRLTINRTQ